MSPDMPLHYKWGSTPPSSRAIPYRVLSAYRLPKEKNTNLRPLRLRIPKNGKNTGHYCPYITIYNPCITPFSTGYGVRDRGQWPRAPPPTVVPPHFPYRGIT